MPGQPACHQTSDHQPGRHVQQRMADARTRSIRQIRRTSWTSQMISLRGAVDR